MTLVLVYYIFNTPTRTNRVGLDGRNAMSEGKRRRLGLAGMTLLLALPVTAGETRLEDWHVRLGLESLNVRWVGQDVVRSSDDGGEVVHVLVSRRERTPSSERPGAVPGSFLGLHVESPAAEQLRYSVDVKPVGVLVATLVIGWSAFDESGELLSEAHDYQVLEHDDPLGPNEQRFEEVIAVPDGTAELVFYLGNWGMPAIHVTDLWLAADSGASSRRGGSASCRKGATKVLCTYGQTVDEIRRRCRLVPALDGKLSPQLDGE
ncbi:MAG: hypothetical protein AAF533_23665 [Acidobacteriota bacterium]